MSVKHDPAAWAATMADDVLATIKSSPGKTIVPGALSTAGARAMAVLQQLAGRSPGASVQLVHGEVLGEGGMGIVRVAEQVSLGRNVAVKTLKRRDPAAALDLLREAWVTGAIEHPNVVPVHFVELDEGGMPLVVLKRVEGAPWSQLLTDPAEVARRFGAHDLLAWNLGVLMAVLNAIRYAHHRGVIHRDLKPSNVMIGDFGEVYLLDWGIAVSLRDDGSGRLPLAKDATELAGTPSYMAPEMLGRSDSPPLSERTDVYLAGAVLFELIAGHVPHEGNDAITVIASIISGQPELPASAPHELARICMRAMASEPADRYATVEELRLALQAYLEHRGSTELGARAQARLAELRALLATEAPARDDVYRVFGACRFGFHEALAVWRDNAEAKAGLHAAITSVAEYELAGGHPAAALALLGDIDAPELAAKARAAADARAKEVAELEHMRDQQDTTVGRRTRTFMTTVFGAVFTALPILNVVHPMIHTAYDHAKGAGLMLLGVGGFMLWARRTLLATQFNRRLSLMLLWLFAVQLALALGAGIYGLSGEATQATYPLLWAALSGAMAIALDLWLWPTPLAYLVSFLVSCRWPGARPYLIAASNAVFAINGIVRWWPKTWETTAAERERFKMRGVFMRAKK